MTRVTDMRTGRVSTAHVVEMTSAEWAAQAEEYPPGKYTLLADGRDYRIYAPEGEPWHGYFLYGTEPGSITVYGPGDGYAIRGGQGDGDAIRDGSGNGSATRYGSGNGNAYRDGSGCGSAFHYGPGLGGAFSGVKRRGS